MHKEINDLRHVSSLGSIFSRKCKSYDIKNSTSDAYNWSANKIQIAKSKLQTLSVAIGSRVYRMVSAWVQVWGSWVTTSRLVSLFNTVPLWIHSMTYKSGRLNWRNRGLSWFLTGRTSRSWYNACLSGQHWAWTLRLPTATPVFRIGLVTQFCAQIRHFHYLGSILYFSGLLGSNVSSTARFLEFWREFLVKPSKPIPGRNPCSDNLQGLPHRHRILLDS